MSGNRHSRRGRRRRLEAERRRGGWEMELKRGRGKYGDRPQLRRRYKGALTQAEVETFLAELAETCNVCHSAGVAGRAGTRIFYDLRRRDEGFRAAWMAALAEGYERLEMEMVHRARFGTPKDVFYRGRKVATTRVFNDSVALRLLQLHRQTIERMRAADSAPRRDPGKLFDELAARVAEMETEELAEAQGGGRGAA